MNASVRVVNGIAQTEIVMQQMVTVQIQKIQQLVNEKLKVKRIKILIFDSIKIRFFAYFQHQRNYANHLRWKHQKQLV